MLQKIQELVAENNDLADKNSDLSDEVKKQKIEITELNQYGRRENVEFCNVPESIDQQSLENHIITVMKSIGINVPAHQIIGVHRIGKKRPNRPRNVIVRFVNRKNAFSLLKNKKKLNTGIYKRYFIIENLCPYNRQIFNYLYKSKKNDEIHSVWSFNGQVYAKVNENDDPSRIQHFDDIDDLFEDSDYGENGEESNENGDDDAVNSQSEGNFFAKAGFGGRVGFTPKSSPKKKTKRRLSDITEESVLRTPIEPLIIKV